MVLFWPSMNRQVVVTTITSEHTLVVSFLGQGVGVEVDPEEQELLPDLTHPAMAGILLSMWLEVSPQAALSLNRWGHIEGSQTLQVTQTQPKRWSITMSLSLFGQKTQESLGAALARVLMGTWQRQKRLTPMKLRMEPDGNP
jgi:hypothetical protein